jgi:hypothetical protein
MYTQQKSSAGYCLGLLNGKNNDRKSRDKVSLNIFDKTVLLLDFYNI